MSTYAAVILAAGRGTRFAAAGGLDATKLVAAHRGQALVRHAVRAALASQAAPVIVVTGHAHKAVEAVLADLAVRPLHNPDFAAGLSCSLRCGLTALPPEAAGAVVLLADMPEVTSGIIDGLIERARAKPAADAVVPVHRGRRGNPVLLGRALFGRLKTLSGDRGARGLLEDPALLIEEVEQPVGIHDDVDRPDDLRRLGESPADGEA